MKKILFSIGAFVVIGLGIFVLSIYGQTPGVSSEKISVVTTLFPQYDFAKAIGGDKVDVTLLLPPGVEAHAYEPKPSDITKINTAQIFAYTGEFMEPWAHDIIESADKKVKVVDASVGIEMMEEEDDEHEEEEGEHGESAHPWEWAGAFDLAQGEYTWSFAKVDGEYADPKMKMAIFSSESGGAESIESTEASAEEAFATAGVQKQNAEVLTPDGNYELVFDIVNDITSYNIVIEQPGVYVFFTEHMPFEFEAGEHFFKDANQVDVEPIAQEPEIGSHEHGHVHDEHSHHHGGVDPHIWLDFDNVKTMAENITRALTEVDPENTQYYENNLKSYQSKITELDNAYKNTLSSCESKTIIYGGHYAFGYMAKRYGLEYVSAQGFSPDAEPTAKDMIALIEQVKNENISYIFYEELTSPKIAETLANETSAELLLLNGAHNLTKEDYDSGATFVSLMEENLKNLAIGLDCQK